MLDLSQALALRWNHFAELQDALGTSCNPGGVYRAINAWQQAQGVSWERPKFGRLDRLQLEVAKELRADAPVPPEVGEILSKPPVVSPGDSSQHPLFSLVTRPGFDPHACFFAQPTRPLEDAKVTAVGLCLGASPPLMSPQVRPIDFEAHTAATRALAAMRSVPREALLALFAHVPAASGPSLRLISRSMFFPKAPPYWMGRTMETAPGAHLALVGPELQTLTDADTKGAGRTAGAPGGGDGRLSLFDAQLELFYGDLLWQRGVRSSVGACIITARDRVVLVRFMREARRLGSLEAFDLVRRALTLRYCMIKLAARGELAAEADVPTYFAWFCDRLAENAAALAGANVLMSALHPQNVTLAGEVVDHEGTTVVPPGSSEDSLLRAHFHARPNETFGNQPGRLLMLVRYLRKQLAPLCSDTDLGDPTDRFVDTFQAALARSRSSRFARRLDASAFDLLEDALWAWGPPPADV